METTTGENRFGGDHVHQWQHRHTERFVQIEIRFVRLVVSAGVLIKHENIVAAMTGEQERVFPMIDVENDVYIAYLPLAHILELSCGLTSTSFSSAEERKKPFVFLFVQKFSFTIWE